MTMTSPSGLNIPHDLIRLPYALPGCARLIAGGGPLKIVALGSSSTAGAYASSPVASYPARLEVELGCRFPEAGITVLNRGENGEDAAENLARFDKSVAAERPDLVLWQIGTNWLVQDRSIAEFQRLTVEGLGRIRSIGAEAVLIDTQFAPELLAKPDLSTMLDGLVAAGRQFQVGVFRRFLIMQYWHTELQIPIDTFLASDNLHMNDWSYRAMAALLATALADAFVSPTSS